MSAPQGFGAAVRAMLAPRRMAAQAVGFAVGIALVAWVVKGAIDAANDPSRAGILECVRAAWESRPWLVAGIALTTVLSLVIDGALFWLILLPVRRLGFMEIQWLTFVTATSNFFPVRLGIPVRYAYAMLANRMGFLEATAWFVALTLVILVSLGAVVAATAAVPVPGVAWALLVLVALAAGGWILQRAAGLGPVRTRMGDWTPMLTTPRTYWAGALLRVAEVLLWVVRMWCAAEILGLGLSFATVTVLGVASIAVMLNPVGRIGFREATTVVVANWMAGGGLDVAHADAGFKQLALLESLGEMATTIPMGIVAAPFLARWYRRRRREAAAQPSATAS
jgi:hypothetical protein